MTQNNKEDNIEYLINDNGATVILFRNWLGINTATELNQKPINQLPWINGKLLFLVKQWKYQENYFPRRL
jgi:hypothetical protein